MSAETLKAQFKTLLQQGRKDAVLRALPRAIEQYPDEKVFHDLHAALSQQLKQQQQALEKENAPDELVFVIAAPHYTDDSGGIRMLHHLCHLLNDFAKAYVYPNPKGVIGNFFNKASAIKFINDESDLNKTYYTNPELNTPIFNDFRLLGGPKTVAIYPEITHGNPFECRHVARWILYHAGAHRGEVAVVKDEVQFLYSESYNPSVIKGFNELAPFLLLIEAPPLKEIMAARERPKEGVAYVVRKGKKIPHPLITSDAICIDGMSRADALEVLGRSEYFISFDAFCYWHKIAAGCGCKSLIVAKKEDYPTEMDLNGFDFLGLAFAEKSIEQALAEVPRLLEHWENSLEESKRNVERFVNFWRERVEGGT